MNSLHVIDLGLVEYEASWGLQEELREKRLAGDIPDTLLLLEHPPVFTFGKRDCSGDLIVPEEVVKEAGIAMVKTNRGGRITYHGPGQLVGYFIFSLESVGMGVAQFVFAVEELCIQVLAAFGVNAHRDEEHPGVWIGKKKIAAVGLHFSHRVSQHGFALNVAPIMEHYHYIIPCGLQDRGVTALSQLNENIPSLEEVKHTVVQKVGEVFQSFVVSTSAEVKARPLVASG